MNRIVAGLPLVIETVTATILTVLIVVLFTPEPSPLVFGAVLAITLSRSRLLASWRGRIEAAIALPVLAIATAGVGLLGRHVPVLGALAFTVAMFLSIWLRRFGPVWHRIGGLVALPFISLLVVPTSIGGSSPVLSAILISLVAVVAVVGTRLLGGMVWPRPSLDAPREAAESVSTLKPQASTRMALQLAVAVAVAFLLGYGLFPTHWSWVVLSAYLVCSGNRGRADVVLKSGLRVLGAAAGTLVAIPLVGMPRLEGPLLVGVLLAIVAVGLVLRSASYAFWALAITLVVTLLQASSGAPVPETGPRLLAILVGALCGLLASWFLLPVRSEGVLRRRISATLSALDDSIRDASAAPNLRAALARLDEVAPPFAVLARVPFVPHRWTRAGGWITLTHRAAELGIDGRDHTAALPALGRARRSLREPESIRGALLDLVDELG